MKIDEIIIGLELFILMLITLNMESDTGYIVDTLYEVIDNINKTFSINYTYGK